MWLLVPGEANNKRGSLEGEVRYTYSSFNLMKKRQHVRNLELLSGFDFNWVVLRGRVGRGSTTNREMEGGK